jgi:hypothetical protein
MEPGCDCLKNVNKELREKFGETAKVNIDHGVPYTFTALDGEKKEYYLPIHCCLWCGKRYKS